VRLAAFPADWNSATSVVFILYRPSAPFTCQRLIATD
jgi:GNAT superfamily N-acetyltransferase